jgi:hypothetical protein
MNERIDRYSEVEADNPVVTGSLTASDPNRKKPKDDDLLKEIGELIEEKINEYDEGIQSYLENLIKNAITDLNAQIQFTLEFINKGTTVKVSQTGTSVRRARIQTSGVGNSALTCRLLGSSGTQVGGDITVYPVEHLGTNNLSGDVWPKLTGNDTTGDIISIFQDKNDEWYTTFVFDDTDTC